MLARTRVGASIFGLVVLLAGCSDEKSDEPAPEGEDLADVIYVGRPTDEALVYMLDRTPEDKESQRLAIDAPAADATLSKDEPARIAYRFAVTGQLERRSNSPTEYVPPHWTKRALTDLAQLFGPERTAHAHGTPFNGLAFFLEIDDAGGNHAIRVFTDETSYQPESVAWSALSGLAQPLRLTITSAIFEENHVLANGGPYVGGSVEFRVE